MAKRKTNGLGTDAEAPAEAAATTDTDGAPGAGHNETGPADALLLQYKREIVAIDEKIEEVTDERKSLVAEVRGKYKAAKKAGIHIDALRRAIADSKRAPEEVKVEEQSYLRMANLFRMPLTQSDLFPADGMPGLDPSSPEGRKQAVFDAGVEGLRAGKAGYLISDNPYHQTDDSEEHQAWVSNWHAGQAHLARGLTPKKQNVTKAPTEVRERSRRAADQAPETPLQRDEAAYRGQGTDAPAAAE